MADGVVKIDVILDDQKVNKGISSVDKSLDKMSGSAQRSVVSIGKIVTALGLVGIAKKGIDMVTSSLDGAISRYDTLNQFPRVMQLIGFDAEESEVAIQKLSDGIQGLPTTLDSVASTAQNIAVMTGDLDGAVDTTLALNNAFLASGASSQDAERGLQQYVQMLSRGEVDLDSWKTLQETMGVALTRTAESFGFAGKSAKMDLYDALKEGHITFDEFNAKLIDLSNETGGFADMAQESSGGIKTSWTNMKTAVVSGLADVIGAIDQAMGGTGEIGKIIEKMKVAFQKTFGWISENIPVVADKLKVVKETLEPWMPLITSIASSVLSMIVAWSGFNTVTNIINNVKNAFTLLNSTMAANPWMLVIGGIILAATLVYQYWEPISEFFSNLWEGIKEIFSSAYDWLNEITDGAFGEYVELIQSYLMTAWEVIEHVWEFIKETFNNTLEFLKSLVNGDFEGMKEAIRNQMDNAKELLSNIWTSIKENIGKKLKEILSNVINKFVEIKNNIQNKITEAKNALINKFSEMVSGARNKATEIVSAVRNKFTEVVTAIKDKMVEAVRTLAQKIGEMPGKVVEKAEDMASAGKDLIKGLIKGIKNMGKDAVEAITGVVGSVVDKAKSLLGINSPSKIFKQFGVWTGEGLINGIDSMVRKVGKSATKMTNAVIPNAGKQLKLASPIYMNDKDSDKKAQIIELIINRCIILGG